MKPSARYTTVGVCMLLFCLATAACSFADADSSILTRAFRIQFRPVEHVVPVVNSLLSREGSLTLQPGLRTIIVQDHEANLRQVEMAIQDLDVPPPAVEISAKLILATKKEKAGPISEEIKNMAGMGDVLRYNQYSLLDSGTIESQEGERCTLRLARNYQLRFVADVIQEGVGIIRLKDFQLRRRVPGKSKEETFTPLLTVTVNLRNEETVVLGASRFEESEQALLIVLLGKIKK